MIKRSLKTRCESDALLSHCSFAHNSRSFKRAMLGSASVAVVVLGLALVTPAAAQTAGGNGSSPGNGGAGGIAVVNPPSGNGGAGGNGGANGAGTAGGGPSGGAASTSLTAAAGGGVESGGGGGSSGPAGTGGGGGGGGGRGGTWGGILTIFAPIAGGAGGAGGNGVGPNSADGGGGGGGGGNAFVITSGSLNVNATATGGIGGAGGSSGSVNGFDGSGGAGGNGIVATAPVTLNVNAAIAGGKGGAIGGVGGPGDPSAGAGGVGIIGSGLTINMGNGINSTISGGLSGDDATRANAINFAGGANTITFNRAVSSLTGNVDIAAGATAQFNAAAGGTTVSNVISGGGSLIQNSANTLTLTGANTYSGGTTLNAGSIEVRNNAALGTAALGMFNGTTLRAGAAGLTLGNDIAVDTGAQATFDTQANAMTLNGAITGDGGVNKTGSGTLTLTSFNNAYTGLTTITSGTLAMSGNGWIFSSSGVVANGTFSISDSSSFFVPIQALSGAGAVTLGTNGLFIAVANGEFSGVISGSGGLEIFGGTQTLSGVNTYTNITQIDAGATLALKGAGSIAASAGVSLLGAGTFDISQTTSGATVRSLVSPFSNASVRLGGQTLTLTSGSVFAGAISDGGIGGGSSGSLTIANGAAQELSGVNTYTGTTTINAGGELDLAGNGSIAPSAVVADGIFDISQLNAGTSIRSLAGAATGQVFLGAHGLTVSNASGAFAGVIADGGLNGGVGGSLALTGGSLNLTGTNTYTGTTTVNGGTLAVNGSIASSAMTTVNAGGTLGGTGTVGNTTINGGTLAPGNSIGTLNVQGNLTLTAASTYMIEVDPASADRTNVTGTANLGGAGVNASFAPGTYVSRQYTILNATGGLGGSTFGAQVNTNLPTAFSSNLSYDSNNAYLNLVLMTPNFGNGLTVNQTNVANALVNSFNTAGGIPLVFGALTPTGLTQVSGEAATGSQQTTFNAMGQFLNVMTDPFMGTRSGGAGSAEASAYADEDQALAYAGSRKRRPNEALAAIHTKAPIRPTLIERLWSVWGAGYGGTRSTDGNAAVGSNDTRARVYGAAAGVDYRLAANTLVGFALGGAGTSFSVANGLGTGRSEMFQAGLYGRHTIGAAYLSGALAYGWQDITTDRYVFGNAYRANFNADSLSARIEGGWRFATSATSGLTPYAAGQVTSFFLPNYNEQTIGGVNTFALSYNGKDVTASRSELGLRGDTSFALQDAILTLRGRAAWAHNFDTDRSINAIFQTLPASGFTVNGAMQARDAALLSAGGEIRWANGFSIAGTFEGEFSRNVDSYAGKGIVRYQW